MSKQTNKDTPLSSEALVKEVCRRIRVARSYWDAHNNAACRHERDRALQLYNTLTKELLTKFPKFSEFGCVTVVKSTLVPTQLPHLANQSGECLEKLGVRRVNPVCKNTPRGVLHLGSHLRAGVEEFEGSGVEPLRTRHPLNFSQNHRNFPLALLILCFIFL